MPSTVLASPMREQPALSCALYNINSVSFFMATAALKTFFASQCTGLLVTGSLKLKFHGCITGFTESSLTNGNSQLLLSLLFSEVLVCLLLEVQAVKHTIAIAIKKLPVFLKK